MSDAAFQRAMREAWQMIDPFRPSGDPGSYARGHYNGLCDALRQVKANYDLAMKQEAASQPSAAPDAGFPRFYQPELACSQCGKPEPWVFVHGCPESRGGCGRKPRAADNGSESP